jgi:2-methylisocitrate lyase-like PEP mutase family enzyme
VPRSTTTLRRLLQADGALMAPGAFGPMPARLIEQAGFEAVYMPGGGVAMNRLGVADVGLVTLTEMADTAAAIVAAVSVPVIADADTGFGNLLNVHRTVRAYERAGLAAMHIEDQVFPKRCGHMEGKRLISVEEAAQKVRAAVGARTDPDFMIIARCDALALTGFEDVQRRCAAYLAAGADMLFVESPRSMEEIAAIPQQIPGPHLFNMSAGGKTPPLTRGEVGAFGYDLMILPNFTALAAIRAMRELLTEIARSGTVAGATDRCATFAEFTALGGLADFDAMEREFGVDEPDHIDRKNEDGR